MSPMGHGTHRAAPAPLQLLLLAPTPWQQSLEDMVGPTGTVPSTPSPMRPHRLLSATLESSQTPAPVTLPHAIHVGRAHCWVLP